MILIPNMVIYGPQQENIRGYQVKNKGAYTYPKKHVFPLWVRGGFSFLFLEIK